MLEGSMMEKLNVSIFVGWFIFYLIVHIGVGLWQRHLKKEIQGNGAGNLELEKQLKIATFLVKWMPAIFVVIILIFLLNIS